MRVPEPVVEKLRLICLDLPEVREEKAWTGTRWVVAKKNFAHVVQVDAGWPPAYVRALGHAGPATVLTFRVPKREASSPRFNRAPFFKPPWFSNIVGLELNLKRVDWNEVSQLLRESYRVLASRKLAALVEN